MTDARDRIGRFLGGSSFAVVGASADRSKYGNKVLRCYLQHGKSVSPVNPGADEIEGLRAYPTLAALPAAPHGISIITPPGVSEGVVEEAIELGIEHLWLQPGAESAAIVARAEKAGLNVIAGGPCLLVVLGYHE